MAETTACVLALLIVCVTLVVLVFLGRLTETGSNSRIGAIREAIKKLRKRGSVGSKILISLLYVLYILKIGFWGMITTVFVAGFGAVGGICGADLAIVRDILRDFYCFIQSLRNPQACNFAP